MPEPSIRRAAAADVQTLAQLGARTFTETFGHLYPAADLAAFLAKSYSAAAFEQALADPAAAIWLAEIEGAAAGYAQAGPCDLPHPEVTPTCGELKRLYLLQAWQGRGIGERLLALALDWLQAPGPRAVWIGVWSENHGAQRLYARHGFEQVGTYRFQVGQSADLEFILRRPPHSFSNSTMRLPGGAGDNS